MTGRVSVPDLLTFNGGYVDTASFLALQGLFTAHVTGNFVTAGASLVLGTSGLLAKLLALPVFCVVVMLMRLSSNRAAGRGSLQALLGMKVALLILAAILALALGPFADGDSISAIATGMTLVAAMAIQNAVHRIFLGKSPPTTIMTGNTTQLMMDVADLVGGTLAPEARAAAHARCTALGRSVLVFAAGCAVAALARARVGDAAFVLPPLVAAAAYLPSFRSELRKAAGPP